MKPSKYQQFFETIKKGVLDISAKDVITDLQDAGLPIRATEDIRHYGNNYDDIERLMIRYSSKASKLSAVSGATAGYGGALTVLALGGVDIANMTIQLYRLNNRLALLNGFSLEDQSDQEVSLSIYLYAMGFDADAQTAIHSELAKDAAISGPRGATSSLMLRLLSIVATKVTSNVFSRQATRLVPIIGGIAGASLNYIYAADAAEKMRARYKHEFLSRFSSADAIPIANSTPAQPALPVSCAPPRRRSICGTFEHIYHMTHIDNLESILRYGLYSKLSIKQSTVHPVDISNPDVQVRRDRVETVYSRPIQSYVPFYLNPRNPMLYALRDIQDSIVILAITCDVLEEHEHVFTDGNAASRETLFSPKEEILIAEMDVIHPRVKYWADLVDGKRRRCAEVLIHSYVEPRYITKIICSSRDTANRVKVFTDVRVITDQRYFFK